MNCSKAIRIARSLADVSQGELADRADIDRSYLSLIESGKRQPSLGTMEKIANALRLPFHLLSLLGSEKQEVQKGYNEDFQRLAQELTKLLLEVGHDQPTEKSKRRGAHTQTNHKSSRSRISARRRSPDPSESRT